MSPAMDQHVLSEAANERIFAEQIVPDELTGTPQDRPVVVIVGGQEGDGKSSVAALVRARLAQRGVPVQLDRDGYRARHPRHHELVEANDETAGFYTRTDAGRWLAKAEAYVIEQRFDVVLESPMTEPGDFEVKARRFKAAGYRVEVAVLAIPDVWSRFGAFYAHLHQWDCFGYGRFVGPAAHDTSFAGVLRAAAAIDEEDFADQVIVIRPDARLIYANQRGADGKWQELPRTVDAVTWERGRAWTMQESRTLMESLRVADRLGQADTDQGFRDRTAERVRVIRALARSRLDPGVLVQQLATGGVSEVWE